MKSFCRYMLVVLLAVAGITAQAQTKNVRQEAQDSITTYNEAGRYCVFIAEQIRLRLDTYTGDVWYQRWDGRKGLSWALLRMEGERNIYDQPTYGYAAYDQYVSIYDSATGRTWNLDEWKMKLIVE